MVHRPPPRLDQRSLAVLLEGVDDPLRPVRVPAHDQVDVVEHDGAGMADIAAFADGLGETRRDHGDVGLAEKEAGVFQQVVGLAVEGPQGRGRGLLLLPPEMDFAQGGKPFHPELVRGAAARVVREPATVGGPDQVVRRDHGRCPRAR
jgi:hypothetical protein